MRTSTFIGLAFVTLISLATSRLLLAQEVLNQDVLVVLNRDDYQFWQLDTAEQIRPPRYPSQLLRDGVSGCVSIGFFIEPDGTTSGHVVLKALIAKVSDRARNKIRYQNQAKAMFVQAAMESVRPVRFKPGSENPQRKRGFYQIPMSFTSENYGANKARLDCDIPDLQAFLKAIPKPDPGK